MIRRDAIAADGSPAWVLISQVDHAHLAGELAADWGEPLPQRDVVLPTIYRHDDGWREWEGAPSIDPATGCPRSFLEMPNPIAHEIWRKSIAGVADLGPLAQYVVAEHFCRLRRGGEANRQPEVEVFLSEYAQRCAHWLAQWQAADPSRNTPAVAERAVGWLQVFDRFSLWFCLAQRTAPHQIALPDGRTLHLSPGSREDDEAVIRVAPWPWSELTRELHVGGRFMAAQPLPDDFALRHALADAAPVQLDWRLVSH